MEITYFDEYDNLHMVIEDYSGELLHINKHEGTCEIIYDKDDFFTCLVKDIMRGKQALAIEYADDKAKSEIMKHIEKLIF